MFCPVDFWKTCWKSESTVDYFYESGAKISGNILWSVAQSQIKPDINLFRGQAGDKGACWESSGAFEMTAGVEDEM